MNNIRIKRLPEYNYQTDGYYFVTIVSAYRKNIFIGKEKQIEHIFQQTIQSMDGVLIDTMTVMPNHVHVIYQLSRSSFKLGEVVRRCKSKVRYELSQDGQFVWQPNYYEHIIRSELALNRIREYIMLNPEREKMKFKEA